MTMSPKTKAKLIDLGVFACYCAVITLCFTVIGAAPWAAVACIAWGALSTATDRLVDAIDRQTEAFRPGPDTEEGTSTPDEQVHD